MRYADPAWPTSWLRDLADRQNTQHRKLELWPSSSSTRRTYSVSPGDLAGQGRQVYANLGRALTAAGARPDQVAKLTIYVVGYKSEYLPVIEQTRVELFRGHKPADTLIGVARLARPEFLIEVDAIAVK